eukprot:TRINITY_DN6411_c0_g1_i1.p1 TRINITY_DN6411_c0_g1~~TRINITY_DN6411_c0_g1_i1.p1  ORF type:complete len:142 (+),score=13.48 TRINITY_DN6411_c0_g1_i1:251-676(+)
MMSRGGISIIGLGNDIVLSSRIGHVVDRFGSRFLERAYHPHERSRYHKLHTSCPKRALEFLGSRWAFKEALYKAIGGRWRMQFPDVYLENDTYGKPLLRASPRTQTLIDQFGVKVTHVALSHDGDYAMATVILEGNTSAEC